MGPRVWYNAFTVLALIGTPELVVDPARWLFEGDLLTIGGLQPLKQFLFELLACFAQAGIPDQVIHFVGVFLQVIDVLVLYENDVHGLLLFQTECSLLYIL